MNGHEPVDPFVNRRLRIYIKIGDKNCAPGKEWAALHDGDVISWQRYQYNVLSGNQTSGSPGGVRDRIAFAIIDIPDSQANEDMLRAAVSPVEAWLDAEQTKPDKEQWRARAGNIDIAAMATKAGDATLETRWREHDTSVAPVVMEDFEAADIRDATQLTFSATRIEDLNQVTTGTYTVGSDAGDDYALPENAYADIGNLTGDLTFRLARAETLASVASATITENLNNHTFTVTVTEGEWHYANPLRGSLVQIAHNGPGFRYECEGPGEVVIERMRMSRTVAASNPSNPMIFVTDVVTAWTGTIKQNSANGNNLQGAWLYPGDPTPILHVFANRIYALACFGIHIGLADGNASSIYENNTIAYCLGDALRGWPVYCNNNPGTFRRNAFYGNNKGLQNIGNATGYSNYSDDATAADGNWGTGANNGINGNPATDFDSVADTSPKFLRPTRNGVLATPANTDYLADNTTDLAGRPWARFGRYIGARSRPFEPRVPKGGGWRCNGSRWAIPYLCPFEGVHADTLNHPLVIDEGALPTAAVAHLFANAASDGSDIIVTDASGNEMYTDVVAYDDATSTFAVYARYSDIDAHHGDVNADRTFIIQYGGSGPSLPSTGVYDGNFTDDTDHHLWPHLENAASGTAVDAAGHYDQTEAGSVANADGQIGNAAEFVQADGNDMLYNANAGNWEYTQPWSARFWLRKTDTHTAWFLGRRDNAGDSAGWGVYTAAAQSDVRVILQHTNAARVIASTADNVLTNDTWHFVAVSYDGSGVVAGVRITVDGVECEVTATQDDLLGNSILTTDPYRMGNHDVAGWEMDGRLDETAIIPCEQRVADFKTQFQNEMDPGQFWDAGEQTRTPPVGKRSKVGIGIGVGIGI